ncbi:MAG TPA: helix-turn-helix domain-containing protein [Candidatus Butyricicoccus stercorigallinarum]|nr:helix-turn-helix domain-containing protein [Candidatus Butyricicoccus stercorigallinarum]
MALSGRQEKRLLSSALFDGCETQSYRPMVQALSPTSILKGQQIDALPPNGSALGFLLDGCLDLCNLNGVLFHTLRRGDFFEIEPMFSHIHTILPWYLRARTNTVVTYLNKNTMLSHFEKDPILVRNYMHIRADYTQMLTRQLDHFTAASPGVALALYLLGNHMHNVLKMPDGLAGLARRLNISRATLYRALADLERRKLISHHEKTIHLLDPDGILSYAYRQSQPGAQLPPQ